jgi:hypothetical protein
MENDRRVDDDDGSTVPVTGTSAAATRVAAITAAAAASTVATARIAAIATAATARFSASRLGGVALTALPSRCEVEITAALAVPVTGPPGATAAARVAATTRVAAAASAAVASAPGLTATAAAYGSATLARGTALTAGIPRCEVVIFAVGAVPISRLEVPHLLCVYCVHREEGVRSTDDRIIASSANQSTQTLLYSSYSTPLDLLIPLQKPSRDGVWGEVARTSLV